MPSFEKRLKSLLKEAAKAGLIYTWQKKKVPDKVRKHARQVLEQFQAMQDIAAAVKDNDVLMEAYEDFQCTLKQLARPEVKDFGLGCLACKRGYERLLIQYSWFMDALKGDDQ